MVQSITDVHNLRLEHTSSLQSQNTSDFSRVFEQAAKMQGVQFSRHAASRVEQRGIPLSEQVIASLNQAVEKARSKGARDVVVIGSEGAFIVNVPNNTVVTTMSSSEMKENIFTNIDSAVLI